MTLDKEARRRLRAEARAIYQEFKRLHGGGSEVKARREELERRYHEINAIIAHERTDLTAEAERIPIELASILGSEPEDQAERARLMARYEEIHAILKKRPKSFDEGTAEAAPDADEEEVADWTTVTGADQTLIASPEDLSRAGLDSAVPVPEADSDSDTDAAVDSGAATVLGSPPPGFEEFPDEDAASAIVEDFGGRLETPAAAPPPESDFELPAPEAEAVPEVEEASFGLEAFSLDQVLGVEDTVDESGEDVEAIAALPDPEALKSDSGAATDGVAWQDFDDAADKADTEDEGWVLPALSEESAATPANAEKESVWDAAGDDGDGEEDLPPLSDFVPEAQDGKDFNEDPLLNVTRIGDDGVERKRENIPLPSGESTELWQELPDTKAK